MVKLALLMLVFGWRWENGGQWKHFMAEMKKSLTDTTPVVKYDRLCKECFAPIYQGNHHTKARCKSRTQTLENLTNAVDNSHTSMDLLASDHLRSRVAV